MIRDLTLDEALSDPLIRAVMAADRVDLRRFETMMRAAARRLEGDRRPASSPAARARCGTSAGMPAAGSVCAW